MSLTLPSIEQVIAGTLATISFLPGIGSVDTFEGGKSTWAKAPGAQQCYWIVTHEQSEVKPRGIGGMAPGSGLSARRRTVVINGWTPYFFELQTAIKWRDQVNAVLHQLTTHLGLGVCAKMLVLPALKNNVIEDYTSLHKGDTAVPCHHGRIEFQVAHYYPVSTE